MKNIVFFFYTCCDCSGFNVLNPIHIPFFFPLNLSIFMNSDWMVLHHAIDPSRLKLKVVFSTFYLSQLVKIFYFLFFLLFISIIQTKSSLYIYIYKSTTTFDLNPFELLYCATPFRSLHNFRAISTIKPIKQWFEAPNR